MHKPRELKLVDITNVLLVLIKPILLIFYFKIIYKPNKLSHIKI